LSQFTYDYDAVGQVTSWEQRASASQVQWAFEYDDAAQLTNAVATQGSTIIESLAYSYDAAGNRTAEVASGSTRQFAHNALNQLTSVTGTPFSPAGLIWDAEYRLVARTEGNKQTEFSYDGFNRRVRIVEKTNGTVVSDKRFVWRGTTLYEERDGSGSQTVKRFFVRGVQVGDGADIPAGNYLFVRDHLGSIREMTDMNGAVRARYDYDPYGQRTRVEGAVDADFGFTGHYLHSPSGLHLALYRVYAAGMGRWLSRDPTDEEEPTLYAYSQNDPVNRVDKLGLAELVLDKPKTRLTKYAKFHKSPDGEIVVIVHGNAEGAMIWNATDKRYEHISALDLARKIRKETKFREGTTVRLVSCHTALGTFPQELADYLQSTVIAPNVFVSIDSAGNVQFSKRGEKDPKWIPFPHGDRPLPPKQQVEIRLDPD
jgi:RHS repeat-associated protein